MEFPSDWQVWVWLKPARYTTPENGQAIAAMIARSYAFQMGKDYAICTIWRGDEVWAKGTSDQPAAADG